jgi:hypothetical protein
VFVGLGVVFVFDIFAVWIEIRLPVRIALAPYGFIRRKLLILALADIRFQIFFKTGVGRVPFVHPDTSVGYVQAAVPVAGRGSTCL